MRKKNKQKGGCYVHTYPFKYIFKNHYEIDKHKAQVVWGKRICDPGPLYIRAHPRPAPRRDVAENMQRKSKWPRNIAEDDPVLGIPKPRREEWHAIKGSPQSAPKRKSEYSRTCTGVQCGSGLRKSCHLRIECASKCPGRINGKKTPEQCGFGYCN